MMKRMAACIGMAIGLLGMAVPAMAQSYTYDFSFTPTDGSLITAQGMFTGSAPGTPFFVGNIFNGSFTDSSGSRYNGGGGFTLVSDSDLGGVFGNDPRFFFSSQLTGQQYSYNNNTYTANVQAEIQKTVVTMSGGFTTITFPAIGRAEGTFVARLESGSGTAPSPEVNAGLGLLLAGATFAFLRRRRDGRPDLAAA